MTRETVLEFLKKQYPYLRKNFHVLRIGLIGSFARNEQNDASDIDLLVEFEPGTDNIYDIKIELRTYSKAHFHREIDICREKYLKHYVKDYLLREVIYV